MAQGDREDRIRIRQQAQRQRKRAAAQQEADRLALLPRQLAQEGATEEQIVGRLEREQVGALPCGCPLADSCSLGHERPKCAVLPSLHQQAGGAHESCARLMQHLDAGRRGAACAAQVPYQLTYIKRLVAEATTQQESSAPLMTQRITSSQDASTSDAAPDPQFNADVRPCTALAQQPASPTVHVAQQSQP